LTSLDAAAKLIGTKAANFGCVGHSGETFLAWGALSQFFPLNDSC
jgi:hypothetical protein